MATAVAEFDNLFAAVIPEIKSNIPRCQHSVYDPHNDGRKALYCGLCSPFGPGPTRKLVLPKCGQEKAPALRANVNMENTCPACQSRIHVEILDKIHECAECGERYSAPEKR